MPASRNLLTRNQASLEDGTTGGIISYSSALSSVASSAVWSAHGDRSLQITPLSATNNNSNASVEGDTGGMRLGMQAGQTYTFSATVHTPEAQTGSLHVRARRLQAWWTTGSGYLQAGSLPGPVVGTARVSVTFTLPAGTTEAFLRLMNGAHAGNGLVYWDALQLVQGSGPVEFEMPGRISSGGGTVVASGGAAGQPEQTSTAPPVAWVQATTQSSHVLIVWPAVEVEGDWAGASAGGIHAVSTGGAAVPDHTAAAGGAYTAAGGTATTSTSTAAAGLLIIHSGSGAGSPGFAGAAGGSATGSTGAAWTLSEAPPDSALGSAGGSLSASGGAVGVPSKQAASSTSAYTAGDGAWTHQRTSSAGGLGVPVRGEAATSTHTSTAGGTGVPVGGAVGMFGIPPPIWTPDVRTVHAAQTRTVAAASAARRYDTPATPRT